MKHLATVPSDQPRRLHATVTGQGPPLVLLHSSGMSSTQFSRLTAMAEADFTVVAADLLGVGQTPPADGPGGSLWTLDTEVRALVALLSSLPAPACVFGHSFGGLVALEAALREPALFAALCLYEPVIVHLVGPGADPPGSEQAQVEVARITALMAVPISDDDPGGPGARWVQGFIDWWNGPGAFERLSATARRSTVDQVRISHRHVASLEGTRVSIEALRGLSLRTHFLIGETSPTAARESAQLAASVMPHATIDTIAGAGHMGPITHAAAVNERVLAFMRGR